jgi:uncharacterized protein (TIGR03083 family)
MTDTPILDRRKLRQPALDRRTAMGLAAIEYQRCGAALRDLAAGDWKLPTDCPAWDVRQIAAHIVGMAAMAASMRENIRQNRAARKRGGLFIDALTRLQVEERGEASPADLLAELEAVGPKAARGRRRTPGLIRRRALAVPQLVNGVEENWSIGYLVDIILTRNPWMHRVDIARATGRPMSLTADHDGVLVSDVVAEWAARHGQACVVHLSGPAGGDWRFGKDGPIELDAVEFCRVLSGRAPGEGLLGVQVPF